MVELTENYDYQKLLKRAKKEIPDSLSTGERFQVPEPDVTLEGKNSVIRNFMDIAERLRRDPQHLLQYLLRELGTPGTLEGRRVVFKSKVNASQLSERIREYTVSYVICSECGRPDTKLVKDGRVHFLECEACGATRPVSIKRAAAVQEGPAVREGAILEVMIEDTGSRGDGIARIDKYIIYVQGAQKGQRVNVKITRVTGTISFATIAPPQ